MSDTIVIVGGGLASARVVSAYREAGGDDAITLVSGDNHPPYHRPPLSKRFLRGETEREDTYVQSPDWYREQRVDLRLETNAQSIEGRELVLEGGERLPFERLVLATGARPRTFGWPGEELDGVHVLRRIDDSAAIREQARDAGSAVVVGAGFIGCEVAASLRTLGLEVALVAPDDGLYAAFGCRELSEALNDVYRNRGITLRLGQGVTELRGNGRVESVVTSEGEELSGRLAVLGLGVVPNTELAAAAGAELGNGIVVDERFETTVPGIYAVGDVAEYPDPIFGRRRRIEHWSHANLTGSLLGRILAGEEARYDVVSTFFTEVFGVVVKVFGDTSRAQVARIEGDFQAGPAVAYYVENGGLAAAALVDQDEKFENELKERISRHEPLE
jgi:3-phenylpropionate/trans-cinnamate dioxygenase ferredoxin reductase component